MIACILIVCSASSFAQNKIKPQQMTTTDFTTTIVVDQTPAEVFNAITNPRGWWSEEIEGGTEKLNDVFNYHYKDVHKCTIKLIEVIPNKKVVWHVLDNYFSFTKDKSEWVDTKIIFEISEKDNKTELHFTHLGLVPQYECYIICNDSWENYIKLSLRNLIVTGKGQPNPKDDEDRAFNEQLLKEHKIQSGKMKEQDYHTSITADVTAQEAFNCINNVTKWWTENVEGNSHNLNDEFTVRFGDIHYSKQKLVEVVPGKKVVWLVTDSRLNFLKDKQEWNNTKIVFEIFSQNGKTEIRFTHVGLVPEIECFNACSDAWSQYIQQSLWKLLTTGKGQPEKKESSPVSEIKS
jgi:uncharacterized protein YndB with AHSA1/START domain